MNPLSAVVAQAFYICNEMDLLCEFETSLINKVNSSRTLRATQKNHVSKNKTETDSSPKFLIYEEI